MDVAYRVLEPLIERLLIPRDVCPNPAEKDVRFRPVLQPNKSARACGRTSNLCLADKNKYLSEKISRGGIVRFAAPVVSTAAAVLIALGTLVGLALPQYSISQKGREFHPGEISIKHGETLQIINDDADLLHHSYVDSPKFSFNSGDQQPGGKTEITFPVAGDFNVHASNGKGHALSGGQVGTRNH